MRAAAARGGGDGAAGQGTRRTPRMLGPRPAGCGADEGAKGAGLMVSEGHKKRHHRSLHLSSLGLVANDRTSRPRRADGGVGGGTRQRARGGSQGHRTDGQRTRQDETRERAKPEPKNAIPPPSRHAAGCRSSTSNGARIHDHQPRAAAWWERAVVAPTCKGSLKWLGRRL